MILLWEGIETFSVFLDFQKNRKTLELELAQEYMDHKKVNGPPERLREYVNQNLAVFAPLTDYLMTPKVSSAEVLIERWKKLYEAVHPEWYPYVSCRVRYMLFDTEPDKKNREKRVYLITGRLADTLRTMDYSEFLTVNPLSLMPAAIKKEAAGLSPTAFIHQQAKALTRAFTYYLGKIVQV